MFSTDEKDVVVVTDGRTSDCAFVNPARSRGQRCRIVQGAGQFGHHHHHNTLFSVSHRDSNELSCDRPASSKELPVFCRQDVTQRKMPSCATEYTTRICSADTRCRKDHHRARRARAVAMRGQRSPHGVCSNCEDILSGPALTSSRSMAQQ